MRDFDVSLLCDFYEFTMANPRNLTEYVGFTEKEVWELCKEQHMDFEEQPQDKQYKDADKAP